MPIQLPSGDRILNEESPLSSKAIPATTQNPPDLSFLIALPVTAAQATVKGTSRRNVTQRPEYTAMSDVNGSRMQIWGSQLSVSWSKMALLLLDLEIHYRFRSSPARSLYLEPDLLHSQSHISPEKILIFPSHLSLHFPRCFLL
jgi:hypothetical protein